MSLHTWLNLKPTITYWNTESFLRPSLLVMWQSWSETQNQMCHESLQQYNDMLWLHNGSKLAVYGPMLVGVLLKDDSFDGLKLIVDLRRASVANWLLVRVQKQSSLHKQWFMCSSCPSTWEIVSVFSIRIFSRHNCMQEVIHLQLSYNRISDD